MLNSKIQLSKGIVITAVISIVFNLLVIATQFFPYASHNILATTIGTTITTNGLTSPTLDTGSAAGLTIGGTNANALSLSKTGSTTTVNGGLTATGTTTLNGAAALNGTTTIGDNGDTVTVNSSDWDISATGDLTGIGAITSDGALNVTPSQSIASAAGASWNGVQVPAATATLTGSTNITNASGFNLMSLLQPILSAASALTVTNSATMYIANAPSGAGAGPASITNPYALWVDDGDSRFDGAVNLAAQTELTIAGGVITAVKSYHTADTEGDAASDNLDTINGSKEGDVLIIRPNNDARTVVVKNSTGNLKLEGDFTMDDAKDSLTLLYDGTNWNELSRSGQPAISAQIYNNAAISIANATTTEVTFNSERYDTFNMAYQSAAALTGTVSKTSGSATLTGSGTAFTSELSVGQLISVPGGSSAEVKVVTAIASDTSLTVNSNFSNTSSGQTATRKNSAIIIQAPGIYLISVSIDFAANTSGVRNFYPLINDTTAPAGWKVAPTPSEGFLGAFSTVYKLNQWDYVELGVYQTSGVSLNLNATDWSPTLSVTKIAD